MGRQTVSDITIAVALLEKFTSKLVITPDSEEGGGITPEFTSPVKVTNEWNRLLRGRPDPG